MIYLNGDAHHWYTSLYLQAIKMGIEVPCRQGLSLELEEPLHIEIGAANDINDAIMSVITQRRYPLNQRIGFSLAHGIQKFLGIPESYLEKKYRVLSKYIKPEEELDASRINSCVLKELPSGFDTKMPWIQKSDNSDFYVVDQLLRAVYCLKNSETTRRAYIDFNEGYKPRCISSWHFVIRNNSLLMFQNVRSNDLLIGLPHDIVAARVAQIIMSKIFDVKIGALHHTASIVQIYKPDCAGVDAISEFSRIECPDNFSSRLNNYLSESHLFSALTESIDSAVRKSNDVFSRLSIIRGELNSVLTRFIEGDLEIDKF